MQRWDDVEQFLCHEAARDLVDGESARPCVVAFRGEQPLMVAFLRPHARSAYARPMIEVLSVAGALGADRLMASFSGRAWSWDDPIPPVLPGVGDLRQRVLTIHRVAAAGEALQARDVLLPFEVVGGAVAWGERLEHDAAEGWIPAALRLTVEQRAALAAPAAAIAQQVLRCDRLGHVVGLSAAVAARLGFDRTAASP